MISLKSIKGDKIILREFELKDAKELYNNWGTDEDVYIYATII